MSKEAHENIFNMLFKSGKKFYYTIDVYLNDARKVLGKITEKDKNGKFDQDMFHFLNTATELTKMKSMLGQYNKLVTKSTKEKNPRYKLDTDAPKYIMKDHKDREIFLDEFLQMLQITTTTSAWQDLRRLSIEQIKLFQSMVQANIQTEIGMMGQEIAQLFDEGKIDEDGAKEMINAKLTQLNIVGPQQQLVGNQILSSIFGAMEAAKEQISAENTNDEESEETA